MATKKMTYSQAVEEISNIVIEIEDGNVDIDELTTKLKRAKKLFEFCKNKLTETQKAIDTLLEDEE